MASILRDAIFCVLMMSSFHLVAQVTMDASDMPSAGEQFPFAFSDPVANDASLTGAGILWDYSDLNSTATGVDSFITVGETPFLFQFFFNNPILYPDHDADYARNDVDLDLGFISISDTYSYFKNDSEGLRNVGFGANVNGIPSSVRNIPPDWIYQFPLDYGDSHTSSSVSDLEIPGLGSYHRQVEREVSVEGWGTLLMPEGSYDVLKVRMIVNSIDSIYVESTQQGFAIPTPEQTIYQWLSPGVIQPLLEITQSGFGETIRYRNAAPVGLEGSLAEYITVYPNPTRDYLVLHSKAQAIDGYAVFDSNGRSIIRRTTYGRYREELMVRNLARGEYFVLLQVGGNSYCSFFFKD
ncbi:MAG: T9SS type A sorting domain-containing protein [Flavobacteriales bacterium]|nr:T9SS type A sorting domain-containing protein [Flavobacteriales bacterium]